MIYLPYYKSVNLLTQKTQLKKDFAKYFYSNEDKALKTDRIGPIIVNSDKPLCFSFKDSNSVVFDDDSTGSMKTYFLSQIEETKIPCEITKSLSGKFHFYFHFKTSHQKEKFLSLFKEKRLNTNDNPNGFGYDILKDHQLCYEGWGKDKEEACFYKEIEGEFTLSKFQELENIIIQILGIRNIPSRAVFVKDSYSRIYTPDQDFKRELEEFVYSWDSEDSNFKNFIEINKVIIGSKFIPHYINDLKGRSLKYYYLSDNFKPLKGNNVEIGRNNTLYLLRQYAIQKGITNSRDIQLWLFLLQSVLFEEPYEMQSLEFTQGVASLSQIEKEINKYPPKHIENYLRKNPQASSSEIYYKVGSETNDESKFLEISYDEENNIRVRSIRNKQDLKIVIDNNPIYTSKYKHYDPKKEIYLYPKAWDPIAILPPLKVLKGNQISISKDPVISKSERYKSDRGYTYLNTRAYNFSKVVREYENLESDVKDLDTFKKRCPTIYQVLVNTSSDKSLKRWAPILKGFKDSLLEGEPLSFNLVLSGIGKTGKTLLTEGVFKRFFKDLPPTKKSQTLEEKIDEQEDFIRTVKCLNVYKTTMSSLIQDNWSYFLNSNYLLIDEIGEIKGSTSAMLEKYAEFLKPVTRSSEESLVRMKFKDDAITTNALSLNIACINKMEFSLENEDNRRMAIFRTSLIYPLNETRDYYKKHIDDEFPHFVYFLLNTNFWDKYSSDMDFNKPEAWDSQKEIQFEDSAEIETPSSIIRSFLNRVEKCPEKLLDFFRDLKDKGIPSSWPLSIYFVWASIQKSQSNPYNPVAPPEILEKTLKTRLSKTSDYKLAYFNRLLKMDLKEASVYPSEQARILENTKRLIYRGLLKSSSNERVFMLNIKPEFLEEIKGVINDTTSPSD